MINKIGAAFAAATVVIGALSLSTVARAEDHMHNCGGPPTNQMFAACGIDISTMEKTVHEMKMARHHMKMKMHRMKKY